MFLRPSDSYGMLNKVQRIRLCFAEVEKELWTVPRAKGNTSVESLTSLSVKLTA
jgi:hypothetical protein